MAKAYKCDCCGKFYEGERTVTICVGMDPSLLRDSAVRYDVCSECHQSFIFWVDSRNPNHKSAFEDKEDQ